MYISLGKRKITHFQSDPIVYRTAISSSVHFGFLVFNLSAPASSSDVHHPRFLRPPGVCARLLLLGLPFLVGDASSSSDDDESEGGGGGGESEPTLSEPGVVKVSTSIRSAVRPGLFLGFGVFSESSSDFLLRVLLFGLGVFSESSSDLFLRLLFRFDPKTVGRGESGNSEPAPYFF